jgi:transglutaminase-like putative cysteine protease
MHLAIRHVTTYWFESPVSHGLQRLRLRPKPTHGQRVERWDMDFVGVRFEAEYDDHHQNHTTLVSVEPGATEVTVTCNGVVETADRSGVVGPHVGAVPLWALLNQTELTRPGPRMKALAGRFSREADRLDMLHRLAEAILEEVAYEPGRTDSGTSAEAALSTAAGVCQDHAHVFIGCARLLEVPARYVSGYLMLNDTVEQEAGHGWAEAHVEGLGWVGFDVSNAISPDARYVRVATGRDYAEAAPVTGLSWGAGESELKVALAVEQQSTGQ